MNKKAGIVVILYNIRSVYNVGWIFRTADAAGVEKIYLCGITPAPIDRFNRPRQDFIKVSLGAEKYVKWDASASTSAVSPSVVSLGTNCSMPNGSAQVTSARSTRATLKLLENLKKQGFKIFAIEQNNKSVPYSTIRRSSNIRMERVGLVLGNEIKVLPLSLLKRADKILEIPMRGAMVRQTHHPRRTGRGKESLNVAVAFGIVVFHLNSQL